MMTTRFTTSCAQIALAMVLGVHYTAASCEETAIPSAAQSTDTATPHMLPRPPRAQVPMVREDTTCVRRPFHWTAPLDYSESEIAARMQRRRMQQSPSQIAMEPAEDAVIVESKTDGASAESQVSSIPAYPVSEASFDDGAAPGEAWIASETPDVIPLSPSDSSAANVRPQEEQPPAMLRVESGNEPVRSKAIARLKLESHEPLPEPRYIEPARPIAAQTEIALREKPAIGPRLLPDLRAPETAEPTATPVAVPKGRKGLMRLVDLP